MPPPSLYWSSRHIHFSDTVHCRSRVSKESTGSCTVLGFTSTPQCFSIHAGPHHSRNYVRYPLMLLAVPTFSRHTLISPSTSRGSFDVFKVHTIHSRHSDNLLFCFFFFLCFATPNVSSIKFFCVTSRRWIIYKDTNLWLRGRMCLNITLTRRGVTVFHKEL